MTAMDELAFHLTSSVRRQRSATNPDTEYAEARHRELLWVLDRIATALELGNQITTTVVQNT